MRKKHYEGIAQEISFAKDRGTHAHEIIAYRLADYFAQEDGNFKRDRFLADCGIETDTITYEQCERCGYEIEEGTTCVKCGY